MKIGKLHLGIHHVPHLFAGLFALAMILGSLGPFAVVHPVNAELVALRSLKISDSTPGATNVKYTFSYTISTGGPVGSMRIQICSNYIYDPNVDICNSPPGFDASSSTLASQTGTTDFVRDPTSTSHVLLLTRPTAGNISSSTPLTYEFSGITNPTAVGSFYARVATYSTTDGSGPETDYGTMVATTAQNILINTEVPPYLLFCAGVTIPTYDCSSAEGNFISFGELSTATPRTATSQFMVATNADYGYSITLAGSTLTAGNNVIPAMTGQPSLPGTSQFGLNMTANTGPAIGQTPDGPGVNSPKPEYSVPNTFRFNSGDVLASSNSPEDYRRMTVSYVVNRSADQPPGRYVSTMTYICLGNF